MRALAAVAHSILEIASPMITNNAEFLDMGAQHFHKLNSERSKRHLAKRLESLGYKVDLAK